jgi:hypothetical protein
MATDREAELRTALEARGLRLAAEHRGGMGGALLVYDGSVATVPTEIEIRAELGRWQAVLRFGEMRRPVLPEVWAAYLDGAEAAEWDFGDQAAFLRDRLDEAAVAYRDGEGVEEALHGLGQRLFE